MVKRMAGLCAVAALAVGVLVASRAEAGGEKGTVKGTVIAACSQSGGMLKLKTDCGKEITFGVVKKAREAVKALNEGDRVEVSYVRCPKSKRLMVTAVKKL